MAMARDSWFHRTGRRLLVAGAALLGAGMITSPLQDQVWGEVKTFQPELNLVDVEDALGQGMVLGLLGGFRTLLADFVFLRVNHHWEKRDRPNTEALIALTTAIDPRPMFFWLNGARMVAYDIPVWRVRERGGWDDLPEAVKDRIFAEQAERGLAMMDRAAKFHPDDYRVPLEKAQIYNNKLKDYESAARLYREAAEMPDAPYFTARIHAELLRDLGRPGEAYDYLRELYPTLPTMQENPAGGRDVVLERLRDLEAELDLPPIQRLPRQPVEAVSPAAAFDEHGLSPR